MAGAEAEVGAQKMAGVKVGAGVLLLLAAALASSSSPAGEGLQRGL